MRSSWLPLREDEAHASGKHPIDPIEEDADEDGHSNHRDRRTSHLIHTGPVHAIVNFYPEIDGLLFDL